MLRDITTRLDDHDPGEKLLHEASAEIKALRSKLDGVLRALKSRNWHTIDDEEWVRELLKELKP